jgi:pimeloyl-ACP methyl ester carboxylesterase
MNNDQSTLERKSSFKISLRKGIKKVVIMLVVFILVFLLTLALLLFLYQRRMIYFPRRYESSYKQGLPPGTREIEYHTRSGKQVCFYIPPKNNPFSPPESVWIFFGGNGSLALDWLAYQDKFFPPTSGILLVDYPGYGLCEGKPKYKTIGESSDLAFHALAGHLNVEPESLEKNLNILGHSLGTATGLQFAKQHSVKKVILLAPFTSTLDMARRTVGWPLCHILIDRYDNIGVLEELVSRNPSPAIYIFHGDIDNIVPFSMGQKLAESHPGNVVFHPYKGVDHNFIIEASAKEIYQIMMDGDIEK